MRRKKVPLPEPTPVEQQSSRFSYKTIRKDDWKGEKFGVMLSYQILENGEPMGVTCTKEDVAKRVVDALTHDLALTTLGIMQLAEES